MAGKKKVVRKAKTQESGRGRNKKPKLVDFEDEADGKEEDEEGIGAGDGASSTDSKNSVVDGIAVSVDAKAGDVKEDAADEVEAEDDKPLDPTESGRMIIFGGTNWDLTGRKELPKSQKNVPSVAKNLWGPHVWADDVRVKKVISSCTACHSVLITDKGRAMSFGRNDKGQLGLSDIITRATPTLVESLKDHKIIDAACGKGHTLFLTDKGVVYACGDNKMGQLGIGLATQSSLTPTKLSYSGKPIIKVACGGDFSMIVDAHGSLHSFGSPEYGQLGHNSEGKYFTTGNKIAYHTETSPRRVVVFIEKTREGHVTPVDDVTIVSVACGVNHTVAIDSKKRCFTWGFAGYGRLGHSETKNEFMPRNLKTFDYTKRGANKIWAGSTFCMALDENGLIYFWGQSKSSGEATMYPKTIPDLCGWNIRDVACANKSIVVAADNSLISWGPSPTYGELGYGESKAKSSTTPQEVKPLEGIYVRGVSCGFGHTLVVAREDTPADKELIDKLPKWP